MSFISSFGLVEAPRAQNRAMGGYSFILFGLNEGHGPQNFLHISMFSGVSGTSFGIENQKDLGKDAINDYISERVCLPLLFVIYVDRATPGHCSV